MIDIMADKQKSVIEIPEVPITKQKKESKNVFPAKVWLKIMGMSIKGSLGVCSWVLLVPSFNFYV